MIYEQCCLESDPFFMTNRVFPIGNPENLYDGIDDTAKQLREKISSGPFTPYDIWTLADGLLAHVNSLSPKTHPWNERRRKIHNRVLEVFMMAEEKLYLLHTGKD